MTVVGLARTGLAVAKLLWTKGAKVTVTDSRTEAEVFQYLNELPPQVDVRLGGHPPEVFTAADTIITSPGVPFNIPPILQAQEAGVRVISELELAYRLTNVPIIAITGTNGKTTTTTLIGNLLNKAGKQVFVGGNIGVPLAEEVLSASKRDFWVAEVSSFQLEGISLFRPSIAVLLNISPDHLDRYASFDDYVAAKAKLFVNQTPQDTAIINADDEVARRIAPEIRAHKLFFSRKQSLDEGIMLDGDWVVSRLSGRQTQICPVNEIKLLGLHNLENILAAVAVACLCGLKAKTIRQELSRFSGLEHRSEPVAEINGVRFINDSKATNVGAVIKSLESFEAPLTLIAGGKDKGGDYSPLADIIKRKVKRLILIGQARDKIARALPGFEPIQLADSLQAAVEMAFSQAEPGEIVLLSPACASFDMFDNFEQRGQVFKQAVKELCH